MKAAGRRSRGPAARRQDGASAEWLHGFHSVREALRARRRRLDRLWLRKDRSGPEVDELVALADRHGITVERVAREQLDARVGRDVQNQGVALEAGPIPESTLEGLMTGAAQPRAERLLVALDGVEDPQNVGAIARVAEAAGATGLVLTERRAPPLSPALSRAGAGAIEWLPVARVGNLTRSLDQARSQGFWILAAEPDGQDLYAMGDESLQGDLVVVLGAEGRGIRPGVLKVVDHRVRLPMRGQIASLNVSTAGAILLYELLRRRLARLPIGGSGPPPRD